MIIKKAVKYESPLRMALYGPSGSGKTFTSLSMAQELAGDKRVLVIDTERGSASKYADIFNFDVIELESFHPHTYIEAINLAGQARDDYGVLIIDSLTHEWAGMQGMLELAGSKFQNWEKVTPLHNQLISAILDCPLHVIATMRAKEKFEMVNVAGSDGKTKPEVHKLGVEAIQGKDIQYEFDVVGVLDMDNTLTIQKTRCSSLKGKIFPFPGKNVVDILTPWLAGEIAPAEDAPSLEALQEQNESIYGKEKWNQVVSRVLHRIYNGEALPAKERIAIKSALDRAQEKRQTQPATV